MQDGALARGEAAARWSALLAQDGEAASAALAALVLARVPDAPREAAPPEHPDALSIAATGRSFADLVRSLSAGSSSG